MRSWSNDPVERSRPPLPRQSRAYANAADPTIPGCTSLIGNEHKTHLGTDRSYAAGSSGTDHASCRTLNLEIVMRRTLTAFAFLLPAASLMLTPAAPTQTTPHDLFATSKLARSNDRFRMLLRQFRADEPTLPEHHEAGAKPATATYQAATDIPAGHWVWQKPYWFVFRDGPDQVQPFRPWGPEAACGAPDTQHPGDNGSAWATKEEDAKNEWLLLEYDSPVRATALEVHETFNPGAVAAVAILTPQGEVLELWRNREVKATEEKGRVLQIDLPIGFEVERVLLSFASETVPGWNEIDAVGLRDDKGKLHWASHAEASSTYADVAPQPAAAGVLGGVVFRNVQGQPLNVQVQLPRVVFQAQQLQQAQVARRLQPIQFGAIADDGEKEKLRQRVTELEARVKQLEDELARAKARK